MSHQRENVRKFGAETIELHTQKFSELASRLLTKSFGRMLAAPERSQYGGAGVSSHYRQVPRQMANCNDLRTNLKAAVSLAGTSFP